jgi:hypothetical protein
MKRSARWALAPLLLAPLAALHANRALPEVTSCGRLASVVSKPWETAVMNFQGLEGQHGRSSGET